MVTAVNDAGQVAGWVTTGLSQASSFIWTQTGGMVPLGTLGGNATYAQGMNGLGQVVGHSLTAGGEMRPFIWKDGVIREVRTTAQVAVDINDSGWIVGRTISGHTFLTNEQVEMELDMDTPRKMNNAGQVVGQSDSPERAQLFRNGVTYLLTDLLAPGNGLNLTNAYDINESGQILCRGFNAQGVPRTFLMTPVPEPATLSLLALGGLAMMRRRRHRK